MSFLFGCWVSESIAARQRRTKPSPRPIQQLLYPEISLNIRNLRIGFYRKNFSQTIFSGSDDSKFRAGRKQWVFCHLGFYTHTLPHTHADTRTHRHAHTPTLSYITRANTHTHTMNLRSAEILEISKIPRNP